MMKRSFLILALLLWVHFLFGNEKELTLDYGPLIGDYHTISLENTYVRNSLRFSIGGGYLWEDNASLLGFSTSLGAFYITGGIEFTINDGLFFGTGLLFGLGTVKGVGNSSWYIGYTPIVRDGDDIADLLKFSVIPSIGYQFSFNKIVIRPSVGVSLDWILLTAHENAKDVLSCNITYLMYGTAYYNGIDNAKLDQFLTSLIFSVPVKVNKFIIGLSISVPLAVTQTIDISGGIGTFKDKASSSNFTDPVNFSISVGYSF
jgi:hypothetical protein